ncbi:VWA domain-containing protein [Symmachiella dynata]|uniref:VWA domain-containing protein n=1 Tax=Symmachiella dynata TaxID=2527995 RepID=UPI0030EE2C7C|tara:strand:- start:3316 stop:5142 length:1827 start_codon:yes stop_codon:yes gene_type:complete
MLRLKSTIRALSAQARERKGSVLVLAAFCMVMLFGFTAFVVDVGYIAYSKAQLQNVTDAAVLSAALELDMMSDQGDVETAATAAAMEVASTNPGGEITVQGESEGEPFQTVQPIDIEFGRQEFNHDTGRYELSFGGGSGDSPYNVIKVTGKRTFRPGIAPGGGDIDARLPLFFAPVIGHDFAEIEVTSIATFQPRDVILVVDLSGSMNDDSELKSINKLGHDAIVDNMEQIWGEMTDPGAMAAEIGEHLPFTPDYVTFEGQPASGAIPHIKVTLKSKRKIFVESTKDLSNVVVEYTNGNKYKYDNLNVGQSHTFNCSSNLKRCWVKSGSNASGEGSGYGERFDFTTSAIQEALGLSDVDYPFGSGSWSSYFSYVQGNSALNQGGYDYRYKYGGLSMVNWWLGSKPAHNQTEDLWKASAQPVTALKDAVSLFVNYLESVKAEDNVGLSLYNNANQDALLEHGLSQNFSAILETTTHRQAGHYNSYTNIGAGMRVGRLEMIANARPKAMRMMILITDGIANRSSTGASPAQSALDEAYYAKAAKIKIMTVSIGAGADTNLMQEIADITGGEHFNVPGGQTVAQYADQLQAHFNTIAADRPLKLIDEEYNN